MRYRLRIKEASRFTGEAGNVYLCPRMDALLTILKKLHLLDTGDFYERQLKSLDMRSDSGTLGDNVWYSVVKMKHAVLVGC